MNAGMVIKRNANQKYATSGPTGIIMREIARRSNLPPLQEFMVRQDCGCGSTIGPLISSTTGIRAVDVGCPQLSMHSIRETMGVSDCKYNCTRGKTQFDYGSLYYGISSRLLLLFYDVINVVTNGLELFKSFFIHFRSVDDSLEQ